MTAASDDRLSQRQQAVLDAIRACHPRPVAAAQLAAGLHIGEGRLNITLRSLDRRGLIIPVAPARQRGGWTARTRDKGRCPDTQAGSTS